MAGTGGQLQPLRCIRTGKSTWKIRARVVRMWEVCPVNEPSRPFALNVVLIDAEGCKIEATARKGMMAKLKTELSEGKVYKFSYFGVGSNSGEFMASTHEYKILFNDKTKMTLDEDTMIPLNAFSFKNSAEILATGGECNYIIDMIGLVTNVSSERQYTKGGSLTRLVELELTDEKGKISCALFGHFVDAVKQHMSTNCHRMPIAWEVVIQNVMNATTLLWNPSLPEVVSFRERLALNGIDADKDLAEPDSSIDDVNVISLDEEFISMYPRKTISELNDMQEDGVFVVRARVAGLMEGEKWWYPACRCHRAVTSDDDIYYCRACCIFVLFRVKIEVEDNGSYATFVLFDTDCQQLLDKSCKELGKKDDDYPIELKRIVGRELLFKIEKSVDHGSKFDDSYKVKKMCVDTAVIESFSDSSAVITPHKCIRSGKFTKFGEQSNEKDADYSGNLSEIGHNVVSLDDISSGDGSVVHSSGQGSVSGVKVELENPAKRLKLRSVKLEMD
ncbi:uncharacterized protein LOC130719476 [Lotus japonicus]|uniref:uncharacterized protein LOC130719476 n=1 Tax=Lotus japonicus TaxID=34305 RepID=UPI00258E919A|nr:uncharacterized protein LOC130719476 [Lotus japonicus]